MNILALETSTEGCSVSLGDGLTQPVSVFEMAPRQHTRLLPVMMNEVLAESGILRTEINYIAYGNGPGAFTGVRIAAATAQGIAMGLNIPIIPISTLAILAQTGFDFYDLSAARVAIDARMGEIYWADYQMNSNSLASLQGEEKLTKVEHLDSLELEPVNGFGSGWHLLSSMPDNNDIVIDPELLPKASSMIKLAARAVLDGRFFSADQIDINYLRNKVAEKPRQSKSKSQP
ncbi:MAG: tRNA threonylcarbamoyladenosine biosynthesis protein TsaB [Gammaproteobacteria bacterium]